jgi:hypothetical protein
VVTDGDVIATGSAMGEQLLPTEGPVRGARTSMWGVSRVGTTERVWRRAGRARRAGIEVAAYLSIAPGTGVMLAAVEVTNPGSAPVIVRDWGFDVGHADGPSVLAIVEHATSATVPARVDPQETVVFCAELLPMLAAVLVHTVCEPVPLVPYVRTARRGRVHGRAWGVEQDWWRCARVDGDVVNRAALDVVNRAAHDTTT